MRVLYFAGNAHREMPYFTLLFVKSEDGIGSGSMIYSRLSIYSRLFSSYLLRRFRLCICLPTCVYICLCVCACAYLFLRVSVQRHWIQATGYKNYLSIC